jgi:hypothetical protein
MKVALVVLALIIAMVSIITMQVRQRGIEERREYIALEGCRKDASEKVAAIEKTVASVVAIAEQADAYGPLGSNLVVALLGDAAFPKPVVIQYHTPQRGGEAPAVSPRGGDDNPAGLMSREELDRRRGVVPVGAARPTPVRRADTPSGQGPEPQTEGNRPTDDNPAGLMTREQLDRRRAGGGRESPPKADAAARPIASPPTAEKPVQPVRTAMAPAAQPARSKLVVSEEPITIMYRQLQADIAAVHETVQKALDNGIKARALNDEVVAALTSSNARGRAAAIDPLVEETAKLRVGALSQLDAIGKRHKDMGKEKVRVEEDRRAREEAERKSREEATQRALVAAETKRGGETHSEVLSAIKKFQFKEALETARGLQEQMKTVEGRKAVQPAIDLCNRLIAFRQFLVEQITAEPYRWGWGEGGAACDILGANETGVRHTTGVTAWPDVNMRQLVRIIDRYVNSEKLAAKVRGEQCLGASLLLRDLGAGEPADLYGRRAVEHVPSLEGELTRLR